MDKFTVIGDPHAKPDNLDKINKLFDLIEILGLPTIWLGDLLDTKEMVRGKCLNTYLRRFKASKLEHIVLVGNHDWFNLECQEHSLEPLKQLRNVRVIDSPMADEKSNMVFMPYTHDLEMFKDKLKKASGKVLFCHADIKGFDYGNGVVSPEGLEAKDLGKLKKVISGHYHKYQQVGNITYLGTPFSHSFGETNQDKWIGIYNVKTSELELIETPFPKHVTTVVNCSANEAITLDMTNHNRIILTGPQEAIDAYLRFENVKYIEQPTQTSKPSVVKETDSPERQFVTWAQEIKAYDEEVISLGLEILSNV